MTDTTPSPQPAPGKRREVAAMFDRIAPRYDLLNRVLSGGIDTRWRKRLVQELDASMIRPPAGPARVLDLATGTADLAIQVASRLGGVVVVGADPSDGMLEVGREKARQRGVDGQVEFVNAAAESLPFDDADFDAAMVAFGVRNFEDRAAGLREISRVLRPGAPLLVLEFSKPRGPVAPLFGAYFRHVLPRVGALVSGDGGAYTYLHDSVQVFPDGEDFLDELQKNHFEPIAANRLTFGIASLYVARAELGGGAD